MSTRPSLPRPGADDHPGPDLEREILAAVRAIRYGCVEITIHDSRIVQIERKEKIRFDQTGSPRTR